jgi:hypothetical protein
MCNYSPIVLFVFRRLDVLKLTIESLQNNLLAKESDLIIFSDAGNTEESNRDVNLVRSYIKQIRGFKSLEIIESNSNKGLAQSIIEGVSEVFTRYESAIVIEDDLVLSSNFLFFMNSSLNHYFSNNKVKAISGYSFNFSTENNIIDAYFLNRFWPWGWATWRDRWVEVDWDMKSYISFKNNNSEIKRFANLGSDVNAMLKKQMAGKIDSWAIRFTYHIFVINGLVLFPSISKVSNEGFDKFATHTKGISDRYNTKIDHSGKLNFFFPSELLVSSLHQKQFQIKFGIWARLVNKIKELVKKQ